MGTEGGRTGGGREVVVVVVMVGGGGVGCGESTAPVLTTKRVSAGI